MMTFSTTTAHKLMSIRTLEAMVAKSSFTLSDSHNTDVVESDGYASSEHLVLKLDDFA